MGNRLQTSLGFKYADEPVTAPCSEVQHGWLLRRLLFGRMDTLVDNALPVERGLCSGILHPGNTGRQDDAAKSGPKHVPALSGGHQCRLGGAHRMVCFPFYSDGP